MVMCEQCNDFWHVNNPICSKHQFTVMVAEDDSGIAEDMHTDPSIASSPSINCSFDSDIEMQSEKGQSC